MSHSVSQPAKAEEEKWLSLGVLQLLPSMASPASAEITLGYTACFTSFKGRPQIPSSRHSLICPCLSPITGPALKASGCQHSGDASSQLQLKDINTHGPSQPMPGSEKCLATSTLLLWLFLASNFAATLNHLMGTKQGFSEQSLEHNRKASRPAPTPRWLHFLCL